MQEFNEYLLVKGLRFGLKSGKGLKEALLNVIKFIPDRKYIKRLNQFIIELDKGTDVKQLVDSFSDIFSQELIEIFKRAQSEQELLDLLSIQQQQTKIKFKAKKWFTLFNFYPVLVLIVSIIVTAIFYYFLKFYQPFLSQIINQFNPEIYPKIIIHLKFYKLVGLALFVFTCIYFLLLLVTTYSPKFRSYFYTFSKLYKSYLYENIFKRLKLLLQMNFSINEAFKIIVQSIKNIFILREFDEITKSIDQGAPVTEAIVKNPKVPLIVRQLFLIGQQNNTLVESVEHIARYFEMKRKAYQQKLYVIASPVLIIILGLLVFMIIYIFYIFGLYNFFYNLFNI